MQSEPVPIMRSGSVPVQERTGLPRGESFCILFWNRFLLLFFL